MSRPSTSAPPSPSARTDIIAEYLELDESIGAISNSLRTILQGNAQLLSAVETLQQRFDCLGNVVAKALEGQLDRVEERNKKREKVKRRNYSPATAIEAPAFPTSHVPAETYIEGANSSSFAEKNQHISRHHDDNDTNNNRDTDSHFDYDAESEAEQDLVSRVRAKQALRERRLYKRLLETQIQAGMNTREIQVPESSIKEVGEERGGKGASGSRVEVEDRRNDDNYGGNVRSGAKLERLKGVGRGRRTGR